MYVYVCVCVCVSKLDSDMRLAVPSIEEWETNKMAGLSLAWAEKQVAWQEVEDKRPKEGKKPRKPRKKPKFDTTYNPNSDFHNREIIFDMDGTKVPGEWLADGTFKEWRTKKSKLISLDDDSREWLRDKHPLPLFLDEWKYITKMYGNYVTRLSRTDSEGLYHPWFDLARTVTGRLGSDLQQLPTVAKSKDIKRLIISRFPGGLLVNVDISQGELRMMAIISRDERFIDAFNKGIDIHTATATDVYNCTAEVVSSEMRRACKTVGFGVIYGQGYEALAKQLGWDKPKTRKFIRNYFRMYSGVDKWVSWIQKAAIKIGYVYNVMGRERHLPDAALPPDSWDGGKRARALRQAVNFPIQSLLHDMMMWGTYQILLAFQREGLRSLLCAEVHDSIIIDVYPGELDTVKVIVKTILENMPFDWITVPIIADLQAGPNLAEMRDI